MLDYDFVKNYYRVVAVNLSSQEELDDNKKVIWQIELLGQLKKLDDHYNVTDGGNDQSMFVSTILDKIKQTRLKFSQNSVAVL